MTADASALAPINRKPKWPITFLLIVFILPLFVGFVMYQLETFDPAPYPPHELTQREPMRVPKENNEMLKGVEKIGNGEELLGPEDIAYDPKSGIIYTGCGDGWIKRVSLNDSVVDSVVEKWINTGGRPLGLVNGHHGELIIADAFKGLLNASTVDNTIQLLTDEANGLKFKLTDAVDIAEDGILYFTDASYKYDLMGFNLDLLEGRPYGRFISYDPSTKHTKVLVQNLHFPNGVAVSPDNQFVIFCETPMRRCNRYYLRGEKEGTMDIFVDNLPGFPDNIMYDGEGLYWIALPTEPDAWTFAHRYPFIRKLIVIMDKYIGKPIMEKNGGVIAIDLEGKPVSYYHDQDLSMVTSGIKIGDHLYCGSVIAPYILRLNLNQNPALSTH